MQRCPQKRRQECELRLRGIFAATTDTIQYARGRQLRFLKMLARGVEAFSQPFIFGRGRHLLHALFHECADVLPQTFSSQLGPNPENLFTFAFVVGRVQRWPIQHQAAHTELPARGFLPALAGELVIDLVGPHVAWGAPVHVSFDAVPIENDIATVALGSEHIHLAGAAIKAIAGSEVCEVVWRKLGGPEEINKCQDKAQKPRRQ